MPGPEAAAARAAADATGAASPHVKVAVRVQPTSPTALSFAVTSSRLSDYFMYARTAPPVTRQASAPSRRNTDWSRPGQVESSRRWRVSTRSPPTSPTAGTALARETYSGHRQAGQTKRAERRRSQ